MTIVSLLRRRPTSYKTPRAYRHISSVPDDDQLINPKSLEELEDFFPGLFESFTIVNIILNF